MHCKQTPETWRRWGRGRWLCYCSLQICCSMSAGIAAENTKLNDNDISYKNIHWALFCLQNSTWSLSLLTILNSSLAFLDPKVLRAQLAFCRAFINVKKVSRKLLSYFDKWQIIWNSLWVLLTALSSEKIKNKTTCRAAGESAITSAACFRARLALCSPSAAITFFKICSFSMITLISINCVRVTRK